MNIPVEAQRQIKTNLSDSYNNLDFTTTFSGTEKFAANNYVKEQYSHLDKDKDYEIAVNVNFHANVYFVESLDQITDPQATIITIVDEIPRPGNSLERLGITYLTGDGNTESY